MKSVKIENKKTEKNKIVNRLKMNSKLKTEVIQFRIEPNIKKKAIHIFKKENIDMSFALQAFLREVVNNNISPIKIRTENGMSLEKEAEYLFKLKTEKPHGPFNSFDEFRDSLLASNLK